MCDPLSIDVVTIFPEILNGFLGESMLKKAARMGAVRYGVVNLRDFTKDTHRTTDDRPYGGGPGMIMKPEPLFDAVKSVQQPGSRVLLMTPQGRRFEQTIAAELAAEQHLVFVCGNYEGVDERVREFLVTDELSIGDYVLTNGVLAAAVIIDAVVRLLPGVLGCAASVVDESFVSGRIEYPQYTRPVEYNGARVPEVLLSGDHEAIARWRKEQSEKRTRERRPDLLDRK
ncbi:MAG: tRNA (guanosine(37)-N1)-methyltransferase TrmD [Lentisphaerae bacterium]|nr:tRNA (guanosine(37)-N1)-methyltransferase TrmD [Lentisphaerota bacterium]